LERDLPLDVMTDPEWSHIADRLKSDLRPIWNALKRDDPKQYPMNFEQYLEDDPDIVDNRIDQSEISKIEE